jgi:hypothetical protein
MTTTAATAREISTEWATKRQEVEDDRNLGFINSWTCADRLEELRAHYQPLVGTTCNGTIRRACGKAVTSGRQCQSCQDEVWDLRYEAAHESYLEHRAGF